MTLPFPPRRRQDRFETIEKLRNLLDIDKIVCSPEPALSVGGRTAFTPATDKLTRRQPSGDYFRCTIGKAEGVQRLFRHQFRCHSRQ